MRALVVSKAGGPEALRWISRPDPVLESGECIVEVRAAGVNRADVLQRLGRYPAPPGVPPDILGLEFAGVRTDTGERVMGLVGGGAQAERVATRPELCLPIPENLSFEEAAAIPEAFLTAWDALMRRGGLAAGETALILAAASGVGTAALALAREVGARAIACSRRPEARARLLEDGAVAAIDPDAPDVLERVRDAAGPEGVDVALDLVGAATVDLVLDALGTRGRWMAVGLLGGARATLDLGRVLRKRIRIEGSVMRSRALDEQTALAREARARLVPAFAERRLRPTIDRVYPVGAAADAHRRLEANEHYGKLVLEIGR